MTKGEYSGSVLQGEEYIIQGFLYRILLTVYFTALRRIAEECYFRIPGPWEPQIS